MKKYSQIPASILADIQRGVYTVGDPLSTEMELADTFNIEPRSNDWQDHLRVCRKMASIIFAVLYSNTPYAPAVRSN